MTDDRPEHPDATASAPPSDAERAEGALPADGPPSVPASAVDPLPSRREARAAEAAGEPAVAAEPPALVEPDGGPPTEPVALEDLTTQAVPLEELVTQAVPMGELLDPPPPANVDAPTELILDASTLDPAPSGPTTLDTVFGDSAFVEYEDEPLLTRRSEQPRPARQAAAPPTAPAAAPGLPRSQKVLIGIAVGLGVLVAAIAAFIIGMRLPGLVGFGPVASMGPGIESSAAPSEDAAPSEEPSASPTPEPAPAPSESVAPATGPLPAGVHDWDALVGGECLDPFDDPWQEEYTVVDCAEPHSAQLVAVGTLPGEEVSAYPGEESLAGEIPTLCRAAGVIDLGAASAFRDLQVEGSYPVSAEDWADGERTYRCFVTRSSGEPITGSLTPPLG